MVFTYLVRDPTEIFIKDEAHAKKKRVNRKWRLIWSLSFSDNIICKLIWNFTSKNAINRFQYGEDGEVHTGIGVGHHDDGLDNLFHKITALRKGRGLVSTDDASNWDLSTTRDGFLFGAMIAFRSAAGGIQDPDKANAFHRLMYSFTLAHTAHVVVFGVTVVSIFCFGLMPSGIWYTGLLNSVMRSLGVVLSGAVDAISVGDDNTRGPFREDLSDEDIIRLSLALAETGLVVKPGSKKEGGSDGPFEITSHTIWRNEESNIRARYENEAKFYATFLLKTFPDADSYADKIQEGYDSLQALEALIKAPSRDHTAAYKFLLRHPGNEKLVKIMADLYDAFGWEWEAIDACEQAELLADFL